jgi:hypothetical protein
MLKSGDDEACSGLKKREWWTKETTTNAKSASSTNKGPEHDQYPIQETIFGQRDCDCR